MKRECYSLGRRKGQTEEAPGVGRGRAAEVFRIIPANCRDPRERMRNPGGLVPFPTVRHWREVRGIRFHEKAITRHHANQIVVRPFLESHDTAEGDVPSRRDRELREGCRPSVAVQDSYDPSATRLGDHRARIVLGLAGVYDYWSPGLLSERELRQESGALSVAGRVVVVVVEAAFAHRDGTPRNKSAQLWYVALRVEAGRVVGMNTRGRENEARIFGGEFSRHFRGIDGLADTDDRGRARIAGAGDYRVAVAGERCVREVGVAVDEACRAPVLRGHLRSIQRRTGAAT
ncbi:MAG: hypothetical protein QOD47_2252 [Gemmatimonadaceae bacterium]|nr:hypothetical protein [Gemmatimonadaceae bacterium]